MTFVLSVTILSTECMKDVFTGAKVSVFIIYEADLLLTNALFELSVHKSISLCVSGAASNITKLFP